MTDRRTTGRTTYWARASDTYGEVLMVRVADTSWSAFGPMDQS